MENLNLWKDAVNNTKIFDVSNECEKFTHNQKAYLQGCKTCDTVTPITKTKEMQYIGNVYQTICICNNCNNPIVMDNHKQDLHEYFINNTNK